MGGVGVGGIRLRCRGVVRGKWRKGWEGQSGDRGGGGLDLV